MQTQAFDIQAFIDRQTIRPLHMAVLVLCFLVMFLDGYDIFMLGKIAPAIAKDFGASAAEMTPVILLQQIGLAFGAFLISPLGDQIGRKRMMVISAVLFGLLTLATAFATSIIAMAILRGLAGLFLAGVFPMAVALISEFTPQTRRATFIAIGMAGYSLGNVAGALAALMIPSFGWQGGFLAGGLLPLVLVPWMMWLLPESLAYKTNKNPKDPEIPHLIAKIDPAVALTGNEIFIAKKSPRASKWTNPLDLFRDGRMWNSAVLFGACFMSMGTIALIAAWLPSFFQQMAGISIQRFAMAALFGLMGGMGGMLTMGWLMDRVHPMLPIPAYYLLYGCAILALAHVPFDSAGFIPLLFAMSLLQGGGQAGLNMTMTRVYPVFIRSTGVGWAGGAGRIGGVILPLFGGLALASAFSLQLTLTIVAIPPFLVAVLVLFLRTEQHETSSAAGH